MMELTNALGKVKAALWGSETWEEAVSTLLLLLAPVTPHLAEELWMRLGKPYSIHRQSWPGYDERYLIEEMITLPIQVNSKVRGRITVPADADEESIKERALAEPNVRRHLEGKQIVKIIVPKRKLVSIVAR